MGLCLYMRTMNRHYLYLFWDNSNSEHPTSPNPEWGFEPRDLPSFKDQATALPTELSNLDRNLELIKHVCSSDPLW